MFEALLRRIVEAVRGAIENKQERTDLSIRIPVGYLVACRRMHGQRSRRPKMRRGRGKNTEVSLAKQLTGVKSRNEQIKEENDELKRALEVCRGKIKELEDKIIELEEKDRDSSNEISRLNSVSKRLERKVAFPHLEFGPDAVCYYENLHGSVLQMVEKRLDLLSGSAMEWRAEGKIMTPGRCGAKNESDTVRNNPKFREQRRFRSCHGGKEYFFYHIRCGELDGRKGRIHFRFDESTYEVEIGYIGGHLDTTQS